MTESESNSWAPVSADELAREIAAHPGQPVVALGGRTSLHYGYPIRAGCREVDTTLLNKIVDYPARDQTITLGAGIRIADLQRTLAAEGQQLPIDVSQSARATLGGVIATNTSGPRRAGYGTIRDFLLGIEAVDGKGRLFHAGGRVVKNVAGYDLCKLMVGSRGTLGIITQVTLKLRPVPEATALSWIPLTSVADAEPVLAALLNSATRPIAVELLNTTGARIVASSARLTGVGDRPALIVGFEGSAVQVDWELQTLAEELRQFRVSAPLQLKHDLATATWFALTEFPTSADDPVTIQANLKPSLLVRFVEEATRWNVAVQAHAASGIVVGQLPAEAAPIARTQQILIPLHELARSCGGNIIALRCDPEWQGVLPVCGHPDASWSLMRRIKMAFDPCGILSPGRFVDAPQQAERVGGLP